MKKQAFLIGVLLVLITSLIFVSVFIEFISRIFAIFL